MTRTLAETLGPIPLDHFLGNIWGRQFAHIAGERGRFRDVLRWSEVNGMLQRHRLEPPRLRLVRGGEFAPKSSFLRYEGSRIPHVVPEHLSQKLRDGYTLIIDAVDDMAPRVLELAEDFERVLHEGVQANMYAGWRELQGFNRHCDTHDVIVLQIFGKKYWRVYEGGRPHPLKDDVAPNKKKPETVLWEGVLEEGDVLYIPRGVWHEASGVGEVTMHLTFGIHPRNGVHLMRWLADELRASTEFRADLMRFGTADERAQQLAELKRQLDAMWSDDLMGRYFAQHNRRARSRGWASLPWTAEAEPEPPMEARVSLATPRPLDLVRDDGVVRFDANGRAWSFDAATEPLLRTLANGPATVGELCAAARDAIDGDGVRRIVTELARNGLVNLAGEPEA